MTLFVVYLVTGSEFPSVLLFSEEDPGGQPRWCFPCSTPRNFFRQFQSPLQNHATQIKMADCGGFGNIDFLVKASGLSDPGLRLVIGLLSGNLNFITVAFEDFEKID